MTAVALPPEVVAECVSGLTRISVEVSRDGATLHRFIIGFLTGAPHGRLLGSLKRYARVDKQYGWDEVEEVIATIEAAVDPDHLKHLARLQARRDREHAAFLERCKQPRPTYWEIMTAREEHQDGNVIAGPWDNAG